MAGALKLTLLDVRGNPLCDQVQVDLRQHGGSKRYSNVLRSTGSVLLQGLATEPTCIYQVHVFPANYLCCSAFVTIPPGSGQGEHTFVFPVDPDSVEGIAAPAWEDLPPDWQRVLVNATVSNADSPWASGDLSGAELYECLSAERKACFLNILKKASATPASPRGEFCDTRLGGLMRSERDRIFCVARAGFFEEVKHLPEVFSPVSGALHTPPPGYQSVGSFKTLADKYGNLQLTFFRKGEVGNEYAVDIDIDEAAGLLHAFEVARNEVLRVKTNPYTVREILIRHQQVDPSYDFVFAPEASIVVGV